MTIVFSSISLQSDLITVTVDSAVTRSFSSSGLEEYSKERKAYSFDGVGCVAMWGARDQNRIGEFLNQKGISSKSHTVNDLADLVNYYLTHEYRPHELNFDDTGYHVAGFDQDGRPRLFHIFWGFSGNQKQQIYDYQDWSSAGQLLYNGRNDLANVVVNALLYETGKGSNFNLNEQVALVDFGDFVTRFAAELTREVGPPFYTHLIAPNNRIAHLVNRDFCRLSEDRIVQVLRELGYRLDGEIRTPHECVVQNLPAILHKLSEPLIKNSYEVWIDYESALVGFPKLRLKDIEVQPDVILYFARSHSPFGRDGCWQGPPDLVIEVLSPETEAEDRGYKFDLYKDHAVREYWIINPVTKFIETWCFDDKIQSQHQLVRIGDEGFQSCVLMCQIDQETVERILCTNQ